MRFMETNDDLKELEKILTHHKPDLTSLLANEVCMCSCNYWLLFHYY